MSNRLVAVLILVAFFSALASASYLFFVRNVSSLEVEISGPKNAKVMLKKGAASILSTECAARCRLEEIPPMEYELVVTASGFVSYSEPISITKRDRVSVSVSLERDVSTTEYREDAKEAIAEIRSKRAILAETGAVENGREYVGQYRGFDYYSEKNPAFRLVERASDGKERVLFEAPRETPVEPVLGDGGVLWIGAEGASALFDLETGNRDFPAFPKGISKIAKTFRPGYFVAASAEDSYSFDRATKVVEKNPLYSDFVPFEDGKIVALVRKGDEKRASLLNLGSADRSYVVLDRGAGRRKTVYETESVVRHLFLRADQLVIEYANGEKEVLQNFE